MSMAQITAAAEAMNALRDEYHGEIDDINAAQAAALAQFNAWRQDRDVLGRNAGDLSGSRRVGIFQGHIISNGGSGFVAGGLGDFVGAADLGTSTNINLHFRTNLALGHYFHFEMQGFAYGSAQLIKNSFAGLIQAVGGLAAVTVAGTFSPAVYLAANGKVTLRITVPSTYYLSLSIDAASPTGQPLPLIGSLTAIQTLAAVLTI
jgi:hypothetical protein